MVVLNVFVNALRILTSPLSTQRRGWPGRSPAS
jgi:hypothetical protein